MSCTSQSFATVPNGSFDNSSCNQGPVQFQPIPITPMINALSSDKGLYIQTPLYITADVEAKCPHNKDKDQCLDLNRSQSIFNTISKQDNLQDLQVLSSMADGLEFCTAGMGMVVKREMNGKRDTLARKISGVCNFSPVLPNP